MHMVIRAITMTGKKRKRSKSYEKGKVKEHRGRHVGGPGQPDYKRGTIPGETKDWNRPMSKYDVMKEARKGRKEIVSKSGFTEGAKEYAKRYRKDVKLFRKKKRVA